jgi:hypothetical protein
VAARACTTRSHTWLEPRRISRRCMRVRVLEPGHLSRTLTNGGVALWRATWSPWPPRVSGSSPHRPPAKRTTGCCCTRETASHALSILTRRAAQGALRAEGAGRPPCSTPLGPAVPDSPRPDRYRFRGAAPWRPDPMQGLFLKTAPSLWVSPAWTAVVIFWPAAGSNDACPACERPLASRRRTPGEAARQRESCCNSARAAPGVLPRARF